MKMMKKVFMLFLCIFPLFVSAQSNYIPLVQEGKTWVLMYYNFFTGVSYNYSLMVQGDTIIDGQSYHIIVDVTTQSYRFSLREDGKKVYAVFQNQLQEILLYDFGLDVGDVFSQKSLGDLEEVVVATAVDTIRVGERYLRVITIQKYVVPPMTPQEDWNRYEHYGGYWVEGVGSILGLSAQVQLPGNDDSLISCTYEDKELFDRQCYQSIVSIRTTNVHHNYHKDDLHDLQGRRVTAPPAKGIYVKDGQKVIVK